MISYWLTNWWFVDLVSCSNIKSKLWSWANVLRVITVNTYFGTSLDLLNALYFLALFPVWADNMAQVVHLCLLYDDVLYIIQSLPFVEYELHKQLVNKLKIKGMNSLFRLKIQISVGVTQLVAIAVSNFSDFHTTCRSAVYSLKLYCIYIYCRKNNCRRFSKCVKTVAATYHKKTANKCRK